MKKLLSFFLFIPLIQFSFGQVLDDYRSNVASGTWATISSWQRYDGAAWVAATSAPTSANQTITIQSGHTINIAAALTIDQTIINSGGTLSWNAGTFTIAAGAGVDLTVNGTMIDNRGTTSTSVTFSAGATWQLGSAGTIIRTAGNSSNNWQCAYETGISNIPATSNWVIRKTGTQNPSITTVNGGCGSIGGYYGNLYIENNTASTWITTTSAGGFSGSANYPRIKGSLFVGGNGTNNVDFLNDCQNATAIPVDGNITVKASSQLRNHGTGFDLKGNLIVNGTVVHDADHGRKFIFTGGNAQTISGTGATLNIYHFEAGKGANGITLSRPVNVFGTLILTWGKIFSTSTNLLILEDNATVSGTNNNSFVSGPIRKVGDDAIIFPVGKGNDYQPLAMSSPPPSSPATFWTEAFENSCSSGCLASGYSGPNGAWTIVNTGSNGAGANNWFISCAENGNGAGACGTGCGSDESLHVGNVSNSPCGCLWCPSGDCGAAYDACGTLFCTYDGALTDRRAESPVINCSGRSNINLSFNYIENGQGASDNATLWYYDGSAWGQIADMAKVTLCSGQGTWTAFNLTLPSSANNNSSVKIGLRWVNNTDDVGTDPSFAVDDITLAEVPVMPIFTCEYFYANPISAFGSSYEAPITLISNLEYWILDRNQSTVGVTVTLNWDANSASFTPISNARVARWDGTIWKNEGNGGTTGAVPPSVGNVVTGGNVISFSPFTIGDIQILPIELVEFHAAYNGISAVDINWVTASELNNDFFTIERSADLIHVEQLSNVNAAGISYSQLEYHSVDNNPLTGRSYYRLKQTDFDGSFTYSNWEEVKIETPITEQVTVFSESEPQLLNVIFSNISDNAKYEIRLVDITGRVIWHAEELVNEPGQSFQYNMSQLSKGTYVATISKGTLKGAFKILF